ncbi:tetratricopeptide repeat protein [bacterium]|nr:tetratricopeptide repeat protein [bacterium]
MLLLIKNFKKIKNDKGPSPVIFLILLSFFLLLLTGCIFSPSSKGAVEGYVYKETVDGNFPLEGALASIIGSSNIAETDSEGYFRIDEVFVGNRKLTITKEGYDNCNIPDVIIEEDKTTLVNDGDPIIIHISDGGKTLLDNGIAYYDQGDYITAITTFQQLITDFPDSEYADDAQYYIAWSYYNLAHYEQAILEFQKVIDNYPNSEFIDNSQYYIAYCNEKKLGYYVKALLQYYNFLDNYPESEYADDAQLGIGDCCYAMQQYSSAIEGYQKVLDNYPQSPLLALAQYSIAHSYRRMAKYDNAIDAFEKVLDNYPDSDYSAPAQYYIAYSYYEYQNYNQAILEFQKTINNYPDSTWPNDQERLIAPCAQYYIGWCYEKLEQWSAAIIAYQKVIDNYPESTWSDGSSIPEYAQSRIDWINENHPSS